MRATKSPTKVLDYTDLLNKIIKSMIHGSFEIGSIDKEFQKSFFLRIENGLKKYDLDIKSIHKMLKYVKGVTITPVFGNLDAVEKAMSLSNNARGRQYLTICYLIGLGFNRSDIKLMIEDEQSDQVSRAALENNVFYNSGEVVFDIGQDHISDLNMHFGKVDRMIGSVAQGADPVRVFNYITNALGHTIRHVEALKIIPYYSSRFKQFSEIQFTLERKAKMLAQEIEKMKAQIASQQSEGQQQQPQISPEAIAKIQIKQTESMEKMRRAAEAHEQRSRQKQEDFTQRIQLQKEKVRNDINTSRELEELRFELDTIKQLAQKNNGSAD